jgi:hypothetical protein
MMCKQACTALLQCNALKSSRECMHRLYCVRCQQLVSYTVLNRHGLRSALILKLHSHFKHFKQRDSAKDGGFKAKMQSLRPRKSPRPVSNQSQPPSGYDAKVLTINSTTQYLYVLLCFTRLSIEMKFRCVQHMYC